MSIDKHRNPDGTYNGVEALAEYSGLSKDEIRAIAERVKANNAKLNGCAYHEFYRIDDPTDPTAIFQHKQRYRCRQCGGGIIMGAVIVAAARLVCWLGASI